MYRIMLDRELFFDPRVDGYPLSSPKLIREANKIGTLTCTIYTMHPAYGHIKMLTSIFSVYRDGRLIYQGRPAYSKRTFKGGIEYKCEEMTAALNDFQFRPVTFSGGTDEFFQVVLASAGDRLTAAQFGLGTVTNAGNMDLKTDYKGHWDALQQYLVSPYGGYVIPRYRGSVIELDYVLQDALPHATQQIRFGQNMTNLFLEMNSDDTYSCIIPLGGIPSGGTEKTNVKSVNDGSDVLFNDDAVSLYGPRETVREWKDVTSPQELKELGLNWLMENAIKFRQTVQISAIDLHNADFEIEPFEYMQLVTAVSERHGLSKAYILSREEVPLDKPIGTVLTLGSTVRSFAETFA